MSAEPTAPDAPRRRLFHCSFCGKSQEQVAKLVAGPGVHICDECVGLCVPIMAAKPVTPLILDSIMTPERMPTEQLLRMLAGYNTAVEAIDQAMQDAVDILRTRDLSWAALGETLGVSRQAAWKRFGSPNPTKIPLIPAKAGTQTKPTPI